jgi:ATP-binding cassette subfamily B protein
MMLPRAIISYKRFNEVMKTKNEIADPVAPLTFKTKGEIEFKHVTFKYKHADEPVLKNISFKIAKGETVAFIGSTGCGKSSLINLIPRFCDPTDGEILVNNVNIKNVTQESLRHIIGFVPQKTTLFSGTIESNIKYGGDVSDANMIQAAKIAHAYEFVNKLPDKFNSHVSQGASNLSGGQKQRIAIARALALNPEIFIFDDSFSALDYKTDQLVRADIKKYMRDTTNIIVAQRIGTILDADTIYVLEEGKIVGSGSHNNLMRTCPVYKQIALSQLSKTELDKIHKEDAK